MDIQFNWESGSIGVCGGDQFGTDGYCEVLIDGKHAGHISEPYGNAGYSFHLGEYPNAEFFPLAQRKRSTVEKAVKHILVTIDKTKNHE